MGNLQFRVSSALKDIIGRDLITDDYIAVFELVKNSYDAHAKKVEITFENLHSNNARIIVKDNGKGMDYSDIKDKWLFVAYSAKKEGTEDSDYISKIYQNRPYAGAKGIGRFSCDRLGKNLKLITTKSISRTDILFTDWANFEGNLRDEFVNINVSHTFKRNNEYGLRHGTVLEISKLRSTWNRQKLLGLKDSLAKLISPIKSNSGQLFQIILDVPEELNDDLEENDERYKVNGKINNFIFDDLGLKTTKIYSKISDDGKFITTELFDGGTQIYQIKENNNLNHLQNIEVSLYYLNQSAKLTFAKRMGLASRLFGHVFLYKNGIRVYPFGEPQQDPLNIDERKSRKQFSRLGTAELIGKIEIFGNNPEFKETSSRGNGLIINDTYNQLKNYFTLILERLEKYVVDVQEWGLSIESNLEEYDDLKLKSRISELIIELTDSNNIIDFSYPNNFIQILQNAQRESVANLLLNLKRIANKSGDNTLVKETLKIEKKLWELSEAKKEAVNEAKSIKADLIEKESQNLFLKSIKSQEFQDILNLMHHIGISTSTIQNYIKGIVFRFEHDIEFNKNELKDILGKISFEVNRIYSISRFATKANFKVNIKPTKVDVQEFLREYLINITQPFLPSGVNVNVYTSNENPFVMEVKPIELTILVDNLVNNSKKANSKNIEVTFNLIDINTLQMIFKDDGQGVNDEIKGKIFDYGFTTTDGSGLGLTHVYEILSRMNSSIELSDNKRKNKRGTEFIITFKRY